MKNNRSAKAGKICKKFSGGVKALIAAVAIALAGAAQAETWSGPGGIIWTYDVVGGNAVITGASPISGALVIPSVLNNDKKVIAIGDYAFQNNSNLQYLEISSGVMSIGESAFQGCEYLKRVVLPNTLTSIGDYAFFGCKALKNSSRDKPESTYFVLPEGVASIGVRAFEKCVALRNVVLPSSLTSIEEAAFISCDSLRYVTLPFVSAAFVEGLEDDGVFFFCADDLFLVFRQMVNGVEWSFRIADGGAEVYNDDEAAIPYATAGAIVVPDTLGGCPVTRIGDWAFEYCDALTSVTIPATVTSIGEAAFEYCSSLESVDVPNTVTSIGEGAFQYCSVLENVKIPDGVTTIEDWTFCNCVALTAMSFPDGVTSIGESAFEDCSGLVDLTIPETVKTIGESAFLNCTSLEPLILYEGLESIGDDAFSGCTSLTSAIVPDTVTTLGTSVFADCTSLETVTIGKGVTSIGKHTFRDCTALTYVRLPEGLESIGYGAFSGCEALTQITLPESVTEIWEYAFSNCGKLKYVSLPPALSSIKDYTFHGCSSLADLTIPVGVKDIGSFAFHGCSSLTDLTIPGAVGAIDYRAFSDCTALANVTFEYGVANIGEEAFNGCAKLAIVSLPKSVESVGDYAFGDGTTLTKVSVSSGDTDRMKKLLDDSFHDTSGIEFVEQAYETWTDADGVRWCYRLVDGEAEIYNDGRHSAIPEKTAGAIVVPSTLGGCPVTRIGDAAFSKCTAVTDVTLPTTVTDIGKRAFYKCVALTNVSIPSSVTSIEYGAFWGCEALADENDFVVVRNVLHYYAGSAAEVTIPDGVTAIGNGAFNNNVALTSVIVPSGVTEIGQNAFSGCAALTTATIPATVKTIGLYAFEETALATVYVEKGDTARVSRLIAGSEFDVGKVTFVEPEEPPPPAPVSPPASETKTFVVTFDATGGLVEPASRLVEDGAAVGALPVPERGGYYSFDGWFTKPTGGDPVGAGTVVTSDVTFYAHWKSLSGWYTSRAEALAEALRTGKKVFLLCGRESCANTMATKNESCAAPAVRAKLDAKCILWFSNCDTQYEENGRYMAGLHEFALPLVCVIDPNDPEHYLKRSTGYLSGDDVLAIIADVPAAKPPTWTVTFDATGGNGGTTKSVKSDAAVGTLPVPTRSGYTFVGWFTAAVGGTQVTASTTIVRGMTIYAHWTKNADPVNPDGSCYVLLDAGDITAPYAVPKKATTLRGAVYDGCDAVGIVDLKLGKVNPKKKSGKVSGTVTLVDGKKYAIKAKKVVVNGDSPVTVELSVKKMGTMTVTIGGKEFAGTLRGWHVQTAAVGGNWRSSAVTVSVEAGNLSALPGEVLDMLLPYEERGTSSGTKWTFPKAAAVKWTKVKGLDVNTSKGKTCLSAMKLTYTSKKGTFKGSFKIYALQGNGKSRKLKKYTAKVSGVVVDGVGYGAATCKRPALTWSVTVK